MEAKADTIRTVRLQESNRMQRALLMTEKVMGKALRLFNSPTTFCLKYHQ